MPSLPVRGFGEDGLLVTAGVGDAGLAGVATITGSGAQVGLLGRQSGAAGIIVEVYLGYTHVPVAATITCRGAQVGLLGAQHGMAEVRISVNYLSALYELDPDLYAAALSRAA